MHLIETKSILSPKNGMNLYRGCQHGCIYCDSRSRCYHIDHRFEDVAVKENGIELLELALKRKRRPCMIATGSMSDPYTPIEAGLGLTRRALEVIERYGCGVSILTKSDLILRDLDILRRIHHKADNADASLAIRNPHTAYNIVTVFMKDFIYFRRYFRIFYNNTDYRYSCFHSICSFLCCKQ